MTGTSHYIRLIIASGLLLAASGVSAQETANTADISPTPDENISLRLEALEKKLAAQNKKIQEMEASSKAHEADVAALKKESQATREELAAAQLERDDLSQQVMASLASEADRFKVYGFMDLNYTANFPENKNSVLYARNPTKFNSFLMNNINIYFSNRMTNFLSALVEVRFTFSPLGNVTSVPWVAYTDSNPPQRSGEFNRVDTEVSGPYGAKFKLGGILIERAHFDITPRDWFNIRGGRFLTPYGIWNEDHGSPVCLTTVMPFMQVMEYVPSAQTGVMLYGSVYPTDLLNFQYAVTLSNGRSPTDAYFDMDDNKAIGVRGKMILEAGDWHLALGGYGYFGEYTDWTQEVHAEMTDEWVLDPSADPALTTAFITSEKYKELIGAADMEVSFKGLRLAGEFVWRKVDYEVPPPSPDEQALFLGTNPLQQTWQGDKIAKSGYGLLSYKLPLNLDVTTITPFAGVDFLSPNDATDYDAWVIYQFGLNIKPGAFLTLKASGYMINPRSDQYGGHIWYVGGQAAVSF